LAASVPGSRLLARNFHTKIKINGYLDQHLLDLGCLEREVQIRSTSLVQLSTYAIALFGRGERVEREEICYCLFPFDILSLKNKGNPPSCLDLIIEG